MSRRRRRVPYGRYQSTPYGDIKITAAFWLLNVIVLNVEAHEQTNGPFDLETSLQMAAWTRRLYNFPDLDLEAGTGVAISVLPFFINPDDYIHELVGRHHAQTLLDALQHQPRQVPYDPEGLRYEGTPDHLAQAEEGALPIYYKQRLISFAFAGPPHELDRLWEEPPEAWVNTLASTLWEASEFVEGVFIEPHSQLEFMKQAARVSRDNARMWLDVQDDIAKRGGLELVGLERRLGTGPTLLYRETEEPDTDDERSAPP